MSLTVKAKWELETVQNAHSVEDERGLTGTKQEQQLYALLKNKCDCKRTIKQTNITNPSRIIKRVVEVQCGVACVAAVLSHCRVLADKTQTNRVILLPQQ